LSADATAGVSPGATAGLSPDATAGLSPGATAGVSPGATAESTAAAEPAAGISRALVLLLAAACGSTVANMYYAQPLLHTIGRAFHASTATAGLLVTLGQVGYVCGLGLLVPLGDLVERRRLITNTMLLSAACQAASAASPDIAVFALATVLVGLTTFITQVIVPLGAHLAAPREGGRVVGIVMGGLLIGVLISRTVSGLIAEAFGWRAVFVFGAALMLVMATVLRRKLPRVEPTSDLRYAAALRSVLSLIANEPVLRERMFLGACVMGCFSLLWTSLTFLLAGVHGSHYHYGTATIGLFALAGVAGVGTAQAAGRLADSGHNRLVTLVTLSATAASFGILFLGAHSVIILIVGIMVLDLGVQGTQISNQSAIYRLAPGAGSRLTTAYMTAYFTGGILLSSVAGALYAADGWGAICILGAATGGVATIFWALVRFKDQS
jgi:predicted MFS family arabinose efflux permease